MTKLKRLIKQSGLSQGEVAELLGITETYLSMLVNGKRKPSGPLAAEIASLLGTTIEELNFFTPQLHKASM